MTSKLQLLHEAGQAVWFDFVDRRFLQDGGLKKLIAEDALTGVTSNPSIFEKAMASGDAYDEGFNAYLRKADASVSSTYEAQAIADIQAAADELKPVYDRMRAKDGYVSLEVSPYLANDTAATIAEARRLWAAVDRPNLMVKVPGTPAGTIAIRQLISDGININVTLLFSRDAYKAVAQAYIAGLEARVAQGEPIDKIASVASFFVSRIDAQIDAVIDTRIAAGNVRSAGLAAIRGKVAIANAKLAYVHFQELVASKRWLALKAKGAMPQRLLWASTGTKDPAYPDTLYVDALIGPDTVNTMPPRTMDAFRDHGVVQQTLTDDVAGARHVLAEAQQFILDLPLVTTTLVSAGVTLFADAADTLLGVVAQKRLRFLGERLNGIATHLPEALDQAVAARLETARANGWSRCLWQGDASLWSGQDEGRWLGWLAAAKGRQIDIAALDTLTQMAASYRDAVLLGMGGSSLGPEVLSLILGSARHSPRLHVLDTTDPDQIAAVSAQIDPADTLFIVSSKSGSTMEPELLRAFFFEQASHQGCDFIAVTDPGSKLEQTAIADGFARIFAGDPAIGGRYSVLSSFGMVPAAVMGIDVGAFYEATGAMVLSCGPDVPPSANPGVHLGAILGEAALMGWDKLTILASPKLAPFGAWLEQLIAESTGKQGMGILPVDLELIGNAAAYPPDRIFVNFRLSGDLDTVLDAKLVDLALAGHPVLTIDIAAPMQIGQEFFRWEIATAIAGAVIGINPFDQPDVEDAKIATRKLVDEYENSGVLAPSTPIFENDDFAIYSPPGVADEAPQTGSAASILAAYLAALRPGQYLGFLAYIERNNANSAALGRMRTAVRNACKVATVVGFGPRFLHSTGQAYKGGPANGSFIEITRDARTDLPIPGRRATFGTVQLAQARGDLAVLAMRGQRTLQIHLKRGDIAALEHMLIDALLTMDQGE